MICPECYSEVAYDLESDQYACLSCDLVWSARIDCIRGFPDCPFCGKQLLLRPMPDAGEGYWYCEQCLAEFATGEELVAILNERREKS